MADMEIFSPKNMFEISLVAMVYTKGLNICVDSSLSHEEQVKVLWGRLGNRDQERLDNERARGEFQKIGKSKKGKRR